jgi:hypothetical protein
MPPGMDQVAEPVPPPPSPFARLPTRPGRLVSEAFDLLARSSGDLRRASFYVGLLVVLTVAPYALLVWRVTVEFESLSTVEQLERLRGGLQGPLTLSVIMAGIGVVAASIESKAVAVTLLAARLEGRAIPLRQAVERSRRVFWRIVRGTILTTVPLLLIQFAAQELAARAFRGESEISVISAGIVSTILLAPFAYVVTGIVLGDVGAAEAVRRSVRLFRARKVAALVVALFAWSAQLLTGFGLGAALDLVLRATDFTSLFSSTDVLPTALAALVIVSLVFAVGTLLFTVNAISLAPQVVMFLALTQVAPGLDTARELRAPDAPRFRWLTRPYIVLAILAIAFLLVGLAQFAG